MGKDKESQVVHQHMGTYILIWEYLYLHLYPNCGCVSVNNCLCWLLYWTLHGIMRIEDGWMDE